MQNETQKSLQRWKVRTVQQAGLPNERKAMMLTRKQNGRENLLQSETKCYSNLIIIAIS